MNTLTASDTWGVNEHTQQSTGTSMLAMSDPISTSRSSSTSNCFSDSYSVRSVLEAVLGVNWIAASAQACDLLYDKSSEPGPVAYAFHLPLLVRPVASVT